jgi:hypothetical protein
VSPRSAAARVTAPRTATARTTADRAAARPEKATPTAKTAKAASSAKTVTASTARPDLRVVPSIPIRRLSARAVRAQGERKAPFVMLVVAMLVGTTLALLVLNTAIGVDSIKASTLRAQNAELAQEVQSLQRRVVSNGTPAAMAAAAAAAGLVPAGSAAYLVIAPDGSSTLRGAVTPAPQPPHPRSVAADKD